ncbi:MAG: caspase domain-containing protein [Gemmatimonadales bacterium]
MSERAGQQPEYHVLLMGIDAYPDPYPLNGCVRDIDAIQRILLDKAQIPPERIARLASPHPDAQHDRTVPERPATLANIRAAFADLGSDRVKPDDRVFIYFAGHGSQHEVTAGAETSHRESLVPVDYDLNPDQFQFLYDFELNALIGKIVARTRSVTFILDCCHSTGITRSAPSATGMTPRFIKVKQKPGTRGGVAAAAPTVPPEALDWMRGVAAGMAENVDACQVIAGCLNHEQAHEGPGPDGTKHGLLTRALMAALDGLDPESVRSVPWGRVWQKMRADIENENPQQHPWMSGSVARAVLAGEPVDGDIGLGLVATDGGFQVDAGRLAGITAGARLAVYGDKPFLFPPLGSEADLEARVGMLKVTEASRASAKAVADGPPFELPAGARGRLVEAGEADRLRCAVVSDDPKLVAAFQGSKLLEVVPEGEALLRLEPGEGGRWKFTDDVHGAVAGAPPLITLASEELHPAAVAVAEHYLRYAAPLRMAKLATDLPGALQVRLLATPASDITQVDAQIAKYPELPPGGQFPYELTPETSFCIRVHNTSDRKLRVSLLNCAADGMVQNLGDQIIEAKGGFVFWLNSQLGSPFFNSPPNGATQGIDRIVAIGRTAVEKDLKYLQVDVGFADVVAERMQVKKGTRNIGGAKRPVPPADLWTATETIIRTAEVARS